MLQKRFGESHNRRVTIRALLGIAAVLVVAGMSAPVMAEAIPVSKQVPMDSAKIAESGVDLANIWSLEDILRVAMANSPSVQIAGWELREALAGRQEIDAVFRPQLSLGGQHKMENLANNPAVLQGILSRSEEQFKSKYMLEYWEKHGSEGNPDEALAEAEAHALGRLHELTESGAIGLDDRMSTTVGSLTYYQQLGPNPQLKGLTKQAEIGMEIASLRGEQAMSDLIIAVQSGYHDVLRAYGGWQLAKEARQHAQLNLTRAEEQLALGTITPLDVLREKNSYLEAENGVQAATMGLELAALALLQNIGLNGIESDTALAWAEQLARSQDISVTPWTIDLDAAYAYTLEHRPELVMAQKQREMAETAYATLEGDRDWTVKLSGQYVPENDIILQSSLDSNLALVGTVIKTKVNEPEVDWSKVGNGSQTDSSLGSGTNGLMGDVDPWQIELSLTYRFGDGGAKKAQLAAKEAAVEKAKLQEEMARNGFYLELNSRLQQLEQTWRSYKLALEGEEAARRTLEQLNLLYELGSITAKEVREGRLMVLQAQNRVLDAGLAYEANKSKVAVAMGINSEALNRAVGLSQWNGLMEN